MPDAQQRPDILAIGNVSLFPCIINYHSINAGFEDWLYKQDYVQLLKYPTLNASKLKNLPCE